MEKAVYSRKIKPRIFINMHYMALGGAERALLGLLSVIDTHRYDVDLFLNQHTGELMSLIPKNINLLPELVGYNAIERPMKDILKERQYGILWGRIKAKFKHFIYHQTLNKSNRLLDESIFQYIAEGVSPFLKSLDYLGEYDLAISFLQPHNIVCDKIKAKKKIAWIHTDYSTVYVNSKQELKVWRMYDHIISISHDCTTSFLRTFPSLKNKILEIQNILSSDYIRQQAELFIPQHLKHFDGIKLLSVGRICHAKNYDNIPFIAKELKRKNINFKWYIIGPGDHSEIDDTISDTGTNDVIEFLGPKNNPYPYMKACDIYVQPSRYEGKSVTVCEAQILCKPVIITNYPTAKSQINHGIDGIIVPLDNKCCAQGIADAIENRSLLNAITDFLSNHDYTNDREVEKIYKLL